MKKRFLITLLWAISIAGSYSFAQTLKQEPDKIFQKKGSAVMALAFSDDSKKLAAGCADGKIVLWNTETGTEDKTLTGHNGIITSLQFSSDGNYLLSAGKDKTMRLYEVATGLVVNVFSGHDGTVTKTWLNEKSGEIISVSADRSVRFWDKNTGKLIKQYPAQPKELTGFFLGNDEQYIYLSSSDFSVRQMEVSTGKYVRNVANHTSIIRSMKVTADKKYFVVSGDDAFINIITTGSGLVYKTLSGHKSTIPVIDLSGDDKYIVSGSTDKHIKIWNLESGSEIATLPKQQEIITSVTFAPNGKTLATSDLTDKIKIWDVTSLNIGENLHAQKGEKPSVAATDKKRADDNTMIKANQNTSSSKTENLDFDPAKSVNNGKYYALIIAVEDYSDPSINDLDKPSGDAQQMMNTLQGYYTFDKENTVYLKNPKRDDIVKAFDKLSKTVTEFDNLLIFYAGHGVWDEQFKKGYWLPADAQKDNRAYWFSNSDLKDYIGGIKSKHTLLIADACFSGGIFKTRDAFANASKSIKQFYELPSRKAMTSGALKTVPDESVFVKYMIKRLAENKDPFISSESLFSSFRQAVINNSPNGQVPQYGEIKETGDEGGDFIFIHRK